MAQIADGTTKISLRLKGDNNGIDLRQIMVEIIKDIPDCEAGGHANAAGALIQTDLEEKFIENAKAVLERKAMEETV